MSSTTYHLNPLLVRKTARPTTAPSYPRPHPRVLWTEDDIYAEIRTQKILAMKNSSEEITCENYIKLLRVAEITWKDIQVYAANSCLVLNDVFERKMDEHSGPIIRFKTKGGELYINFRTETGWSSDIDHLYFLLRSISAEIDSKGDLTDWMQDTEIDIQNTALVCKVAHKRRQVSVMVNAAICVEWKRRQSYRLWLFPIRILSLLLLGERVKKGDSEATRKFIISYPPVEATAPEVQRWIGQYLEIGNANWDLEKQWLDTWNIDRRKLEGFHRGQIMSSLEGCGYEGKGKLNLLVDEIVRARRYARCKTHGRTMGYLRGWLDDSDFQDILPFILWLSVQAASLRLYSFLTRIHDNTARTSDFIMLMVTLVLSVISVTTYRYRFRLADLHGVFWLVLIVLLMMGLGLLAWNTVETATRQFGS